MPFIDSTVHTQDFITSSTITAVVVVVVASFVLELIAIAVVVGMGATSSFIDLQKR